MTTKHSPGPWSLWTEYNSEPNAELLENHICVDAPSHGALAQVVWVMEDDRAGGRNSPVCEANARLIAAAPELLDALTAANDLITKFLPAAKHLSGSELNIGQLNETLLAITSAIRKATEEKQP